MDDRPSKFSYTTKSGETVSVGDLVVIYGQAGVIQKIVKANNGRWRAVMQPFKDKVIRSWAECSTYNERYSYFMSLEKATKRKANPMDPMGDCISCLT